MKCVLEAKKIVVDAGHGGKDPGADAHGVREKDVVLVYSDALMEELRWRGHQPKATRQEDVFVELAERARIANEYEADVFVSLHVNASSNDQAQGAWMLHYTNSLPGRELGLRVAERLQCVPGVMRTLAVYPDGAGWTGGRGLAVLRRTSMPALLVELGFVTNAEDRKMLMQEFMPGRMARAIADGIEDWFRGGERP